MQKYKSLTGKRFQNRPKIISAKEAPLRYSKSESIVSNGPTEIVYAGESKKLKDITITEMPLTSNKVGKLGTMEFKEVNKINIAFTPNKAGNQVLELIKNRKGLYIRAIRAHSSGIAAEFLKRAERIAQHRGSTYIYLLATNFRMKTVAESQGYVPIGKTIFSETDDILIKAI